MVRAKFTVDKTESQLYRRQIDPAKGWGSDNTENVEMKTIVLRPVYANNDPEHENSKFWNASPSGEIKLGTINPQAWQYFELGKEYYIDFTLAEVGVAASAAQGE